MNYVTINSKRSNRRT